MRVLTLWPRYATLMAYGVKTVETRSWGTDYRGDIAIVSGKSLDNLRCGCGPYLPAQPNYADATLPPWLLLGADPDTRGPLPVWLGAIVCIVELADIVTVGPEVTLSRNTHRHGGLGGAPGGWLTVQHRSGQDTIEHTIIDAAQLPLGEYDEGRKLWLTRKLRRLHVPLPHRGIPGLTELDDDIAAEALDRAA